MKTPHPISPAAKKPGIDFAAITCRFRQAAEEGRFFLFEQEVYDLLSKSGAETPPRCQFLRNGTHYADSALTGMPGERVVLKIVSTTLVHKSEVGGVRVVDNTPNKIRSAWRRMTHEVAETYADWISRHSNLSPIEYRGLTGNALLAAVSRDIRGVLMVQYMPPDSAAFGNELIVGIRWSREFGMILNAGLGGTDTELYARKFKKRQAVVSASTVMTDGPAFFKLFQNTLAYRKLAGLTRAQRRIVTDEQLLECFSSFIAMANYFSPANPEAPFVIEELEINPFAFTDFLMVPLDGLCRFSMPPARRIARPVKKIENLLHPERIGIIGVSASRMNFGRIILKNILAAGFHSKDVAIIRPGLTHVDGVRCVPDLSSLNAPLDLLVVAVAASQVPAIAAEVIARNSARAVMLIPSGIGEKKGSETLAKQLDERIREAHLQPEGGPVFLGSNCLGVVSHPGRYDTLFIPEEKLPKRRGSHRRTAAFISQSGAFMITRISRNPCLDPAYMISLGNQTDLTLGDIMTYLKDSPLLHTIAVYAEGFKDQDGLDFARAVRDAVRMGKEVVFYKAGRTPEGQMATSGHTASLAGDYTVCESCICQAGGMVAQTFTQFEDLFMLSHRLHGKTIRGNRLAAVSGAGFEAVGMADSIQSDDYAMQLAVFGPDTAQAIKQVLREKKLNELVDIKNPLDINPAADDAAHAAIVNILLQDPGIDAVVAGLDPLSPATYTLAGDMKYALNAENSIARLLPEIAARSEKPVIGVVDGGSLYDPLVARIESSGLPVFRSSDRAVAAIALYISGRLASVRIRSSDAISF
ncbi:MAG: acetate--CoA ligase family protein [Desulfobacterales bacterium]|nr:acetate--CoA ligase family protein [Desulfobacterales bacterium]